MVNCNAMSTVNLTECQKIALMWVSENQMNDRPQALGYEIYRRPGVLRARKRLRAQAAHFQGMKQLRALERIGLVTVGLWFYMGISYYGAKLTDEGKAYLAKMRGKNGHL